ncbi:hypothetical protein SELMODRAFT_408973 [Selaginella moellendorffii]|uniref:Uncharacterized protein n=1 Tax=Selaginella moellendorffii TaxID=88036 RepID=D8R924_SELML|nr:hypothetical protein SELMODRAFT_408973 [Selaginella moellendorffii]
MMSERQSLSLSEEGLTCLCVLQTQANKELIKIGIAATIFRKETGKFLRSQHHSVENWKGSEACRSQLGHSHSKCRFIGRLLAKDPVPAPKRIIYPAVPPTQPVPIRGPRRKMRVSFSSCQGVEASSGSSPTQTSSMSLQKAPRHLEQDNLAVHRGVHANVSSSVIFTSSELNWHNLEARGHQMIHTATGTVFTCQETLETSISVQQKT